MKVDVHGTCVSFNLLKKNDGIGFQHRLDGVETNLYFSHVNIAGSVFQAINAIPAEADFIAGIDHHTIRNIITDLSKNVIDKLLNSEAEWLMVDFYDFARIQWIYENGCYTHTADLSIAAPEYYKRVQNQISGYFRWIDIPEFIWYPYVDNYFELIMPKFKDHIILNRLCMNQYCITEQGMMAEIPSETAYLGSYRDNQKIRRLEDHVISKFGLKTIDISKYYFSDWAFKHDVLSVHYETDYYKRGGEILRDIINGRDTATDVLGMEGLHYKVEKSRLLAPECRELYFSKSPWRYYDLLDEMIMALSPKEQEQNKQAILGTYEFYDSRREWFQSELPDSVKQEVLIQKFIELSGEN